MEDVISFGWSFDPNVSLAGVKFGEEVKGLLFRDQVVVLFYMRVQLILCMLYDVFC